MEIAEKSGLEKLDREDPHNEAPVLLVVFNRLDCALEVLSTIRSVRPRRFYIASDGGRNLKEAELVESIRKRLIEEIDWECELMTLFRDRNLGCRRAVSGAISWFFESEPCGIVLEDDCLPYPSFFPYCSQLLRKYRDDDRIATVAGSRFHCYPRTRDDQRPEASSVFHCWGWAGWRRSWDYDDSRPMPSWEMVDKLCQTRRERFYWKAVLDSCASKEIDSWAYRYSLSCFERGLRHVIPPCNLILNTGFEGVGMHSTRRPFIAPSTFDAFDNPLNDAVDFEDKLLDDEYYSTQFRSLPVRLLKRISYSVKNLRRSIH